MIIFVTKTTRLPSSSGNPKWLFHTDEAEVFVTKPNIMDAYVISDGFVGPLNVILNKKRQIEALVRVHNDCYSDHYEDIRTKGSCDYCGGTD